MPVGALKGNVIFRSTLAPESLSWKLEAGSQKQELEARARRWNQNLEDGSQKPEAGSQEQEVESQKLELEARSWKPEARTRSVDQGAQTKGSGPQGRH